MNQKQTDVAFPDWPFLHTYGRYKKMNRRLLRHIKKYTASSYEEYIKWLAEHKPFVLRGL